MMSQVTLDVGLLLVEFTGRTHHTDPEYPNGYEVDHFEDMMFSNNYYHTENNEIESPDGEDVFGSLNDYFQYQSHGILSITGDIINSVSNNIPNWLPMGAPTNYDDLGESDDLIEDAITAAINDSGWDCDYDIIAIIVSQHDETWYGTGVAYYQNSFSSGDFPGTFDYSNWFGAYVFNERNDAEYDDANDVTFSHIGIHCHEMFHVIGWGMYQVLSEGGFVYAHAGSYGRVGDWSSMNVGYRTGPSRKTACPVDLDPVARIIMEWAEPTEIDTMLLSETIQYIEEDSDTTETLDFYCFDDPNSTREFIIENRQYQGFNSHSPEWWEAGTKGGLLIWERNGQYRGLRHADNDEDTVFDPALPYVSDGDLGDPFPGASSNTTFSMSTTPNSDILSAKTGFAVTNISSSSSSMTANFYPNYWSDTLSTNTTWSTALSPYYVGGDITVLSGSTLTIQTGVTVLFLDSDDQSGGSSSTKCELIIEGELNADNATFRSINNTKGGWYGIEFADGCDTDSYLEDCTVEDAYYGVQIYENITINDCEFNDIDFAGIKILDDSEPTVTDCKIEADAIGIYIYSGSGTFQYIDFEGPFTESAGSGVYALGSDNTYFYYCDFDLSTTDCHGTYNKYSTSLDVIYTNMDVPGASHYYMKEVSSGPTSEISYSYLGCLAENVDESDFYGDVTYSYISDYAVYGAGATWKKANGNDYSTAREMMRSKNYHAAYALLMNLVNDFKTENKSECLQLAMQASKKNGSFKNQKEQLEDFLNHSEKSVREAAEVWLSIYYEHTGEFAKAQQIVNDTNLTGELKQSILFNLAAAYDNAGFDEKAVSIFEQMIQEFPEEKDELFEFIREMNSDNSRPDENQDKLTATNTSGLENTVAFPNPFNSSTKIAYHVTNPCHVQVHIYDILGREINTIVDQYLKQGRYVASWNGLNNLGNPLPTGIYFYRIQMQDRVLTNKILLLR